MSVIAAPAHVASSELSLHCAATEAALEVFRTPITGAELPDAPAHDHADANWIVLDGNARLHARCSLWWTRTPAHENERVGLIGHYAATSPEASDLLLQGACSALARHHCALAVGPMDGSTWKRYRFVTERGGEPPFLLEPDNPDEWPLWFRRAGFMTFASYFSSLSTGLSREDPRVAQMAERAQQMGVEIRRLRVDDLERELRRLFPLVDAFSRNLLFSPVTRSDFVAQLMPMAAHIRPELVLIAEVLGSPVGFSFCLPNLLQAHRGHPVDTVILKTLAIAPECAGSGIGGLLVARTNEAAAALGYSRIICALMHEHNFSRNIAQRYGDIMRRYELFARKLTA